MIYKPTKFELTLEEFESAWTRQKGTAHRDFVSHFRYTSVFLASDPRDKIFALLHICPDTSKKLVGNKLLAPNYRKTIEEVILDFSRSGIHVPLAVKTAEVLNKVSQATHDRHTPRTSGNCTFTFWNTQFWNTRDRLRALVEADLYENDASRCHPIYNTREGLYHRHFVRHGKCMRDGRQHRMV